MAEPAPRRPLHPLLVLLAAILLPGFGHTLSGFPLRGLTLQMFMVVLGLITWHLTTPQQSLIGRLAGGLFVYAVSIMDAYRLAKLRRDAFQRQAS
jgi:Na+/proline symporter